MNEKPERVRVCKKKKNEREEEKKTKKKKPESLRGIPKSGDNEILIRSPID